MIWVWTAVVAVSLLLEFITMQMVSIWLAVGGIIALILAIIGGIDILIQVIVFVVISLLAIIFLRKFTIKFLGKKTESEKAEVLIGKVGKVIDKIDKETSGTVKVNGIMWTAIADKNVEKDTQIEVVDVIGNKLKVKKIKE